MQYESGIRRSRVVPTVYTYPHKTSTVASFLTEIEIFQIYAVYIQNANNTQ